MNVKQEILVVGLEMVKFIRCFRIFLFFAARLSELQLKGRSVKILINFYSFLALSFCYCMHLLMYRKVKTSSKKKQKMQPDRSTHIQQYNCTML